jgi:nucleotide-binding universal stress UspA family protein
MWSNHRSVIKQPEAPNMINPRAKVLACVVPSAYAEAVADYAAWAARCSGAPLELLHVIDRHPETALSDDHSGAIGMDAQSVLLSELVNADAVRSRVAREQGRVFLNTLRERVAAQGIEGDVRLRYGELQDTLKEQQAGVWIYVLGRRGESAQTQQRDLGRNVEQVVRALDRPILVVTQAYVEPSRVMLAFDGSRATRRGVALLVESSLCKALPIHLLMCGSAARDASKQLQWAQRTLSDAGYQVSAEQSSATAETSIADAVREREIDLLIMGAWSHSPLRSWLLGSKTTRVLRAVRIPTLLLR